MALSSYITLMGSTPITMVNDDFWIIKTVGLVLLIQVKFLTTKTVEAFFSLFLKFKGQGNVEILAINLIFYCGYDHTVILSCSDEIKKLSSYQIKKFCTGYCFVYSGLNMTVIIKYCRCQKEVWYFEPVNWNFLSLFGAFHW